MSNLSTRSPKPAPTHLIPSWRRSFACGFFALCAVTLCAAPGRAAEPPVGLMLHEVAPSPLILAHADPHARFGSRTAPDRTLPSHGTIALTAEPSSTPSSAKTRAHASNLRAPDLRDAPQPAQKLPAPGRTAWGIAGTGASLLSGTLYSHGRSKYSRKALDYYHRNLETFQPDYRELPDHPSTQLDPQLQQEMNETRYLMLALYAAGGTIAAESIILLTEESDDPTSTRAEIAPTWQNGGPAAYFRISF